MGVATAYTVLGNRVAPGLVDWYLGRTGVSSQQTTDPAPRLGSNVFQARDDEEDRGAHGSFSQHASRHDPVSFVAAHRGAVLGLGAAALLGATAAVRRAR